MGECETGTESEHEVRDKECKLAPVRLFRDVCVRVLDSVEVEEGVVMDDGSANKCNDCYGGDCDRSGGEGFHQGMSRISQVWMMIMRAIRIARSSEVAETV